MNSEPLNLQKTLTPRQIVRELDKYIVGQHEAKKAVAIALRNRWRRQQIDKPLQDEITPKNIIMMGPTGVGKTEIARRLAKLAQAPFIKVEATKFTEVGYVGRDVDSMVRDLVEMAVQQAKTGAQDLVKPRATERANQRLVEMLVERELTRTPEEPAPPPPQEEPAEADPAKLLGDMSAMLRRLADQSDQTGALKKTLDQMPFMKMVNALGPDAIAGREEQPPVPPPQPVSRKSRETLTEEMTLLLSSGALDDEQVELDLPERGGPMVEIFSSSGIEEMGFNFKDMFGNMFGGRKKTRRIHVKDAREALIAEESQKLIDMEEIVRDAVRTVEQSGIIFIDEIDKVAGRGDASHGPDVSREGVQRDLLPLVEGSTVMTKYGPVNTHHVLFIASGAFHVSKPSDLIPEMQGRFPIRVELTALTADDFVRILTEPENSLVRQYREMIGTEGVRLDFTDEAVRTIATIAFDINERSQNIGARRLYTVMEKLLEEVSFESPDMHTGTIPVTPEYVHSRLKNILADEDLSRYIL